MRTATAQKKMKKKEIQSSNGFEPEGRQPIDVRRGFEERRRAYQEKGYLQDCILRSQELNSCLLGIVSQFRESSESFDSCGASAKKKVIAM